MGIKILPDVFQKLVHPDVFLLTRVVLVSISFQFEKAMCANCVSQTSSVKIILFFDLNPNFMSTKLMRT
jgi:hypothetical protein